MNKNNNSTLYKHYFDVEERRVRVCSWDNDDGARPNIPQSMMGTLMVDGGQKCRYVMYLTEENPQLYLDALIQKQQSKLKDYEDKVQVERDYLNVLIMASADYGYRDGEEYECSHCGKTFTFDEDTCEVYEGKAICGECYTNYYGFCNVCGVLHKYEDMNEEIICSACQKGGASSVC